MKTRLLRLSAGLAFGVSLLLSGCATLKQEAPVAEVVSRACHAQIDLAGRFSVRYLRDEEEHAMHGRFVWVQREYETSVTLLSPLGQVVAKLEIAPGITVMTLSEDDVRAAPNPDALAREALGWALPVSGMRGWLQGCAQTVGGLSFVATPTNKQVVTQGGWHLAYPAWASSVNGDVRPKRIDMQHQGGDDDVSLRLVIDAWKPVQ